MTAAPQQSAHSARTSPTSTAAPTTPASPLRSITPAVWAALAVVYVVWGSTYLAIRVVVETMPPFLSATARFIPAGLLLLALVAARSGTAALRATPRQLASAALVGLMLLLGGNGMVVLAERDVPSGLTALIIAVVPLWLVLARWATGQRPSWTTVAGVLLGLVGLAVLSSSGLSGDVEPLGVGLILLATLSWAGGSFLTKRLTMPANVFATSAYEMIAGGLGCLAVSLFKGEPQRFQPAEVSTASWLGLAFLVVFGSIVAFTAYAWLLQAAPLPLVATYAYVNPVVAVLLGWLILAEPLTLPVVLGGAIVVAAVVLVVRTER
ncbi:EamA family transporter [Kitasatospora sp. NPDC051853]|uniref:EamA family transporter n=1 Tax=Kitasatospora sp. NPDC051853 TaxID=3364058 RepID=UPI0037949A1D